MHLPSPLQGWMGKSRSLTWPPRIQGSHLRLKLAYTRFYLWSHAFPSSQMHKMNASLFPKCNFGMPVLTAQCIFACLQYSAVHIWISCYFARPNPDKNVCSPRWRSTCDPTLFSSIFYRALYRVLWFVNQWNGPGTMGSRVDLKVRMTIVNIIGGCTCMTLN